MPKPTEHKTVQARILQYAQEIGWVFVAKAEADRRRNVIRNSEGLVSSVGSLYFDTLLFQKVKEFNPLYAEAEGTLVGQLRRLHNDIHGNRLFMQYLRNAGKFFHAEENRERDLILIDYKQPDRNVYEVTEEFYWNNGHFGNREDVVFLINGIPIAVIECKNASRNEKKVSGQE